MSNSQNGPARHAGAGAHPNAQNPHPVAGAIEAAARTVQAALSRTVAASAARANARDGQRIGSQTDNLRGIQAFRFGSLDLPQSAEQRQNILLVSGTRPEIIKLAPVYHALRETPWADVTWLHTAQHDDMARQILLSFDIKPDIVLQRPGSSLTEFSLACRAQLDAVMTQKPWSLVIVQGDTESAFQGALAAFYNRVPLAHIEAGLRTDNLDRPFPEEGLRQMISRLARFQFAPTALARAALRSEGIAEERVLVTGNTVVDAQQWTCARHGVARRVPGKGHMLVTAHRRENWGADLAEICHAVADIARHFPKLEVVFPVHLNPVVQGPVHEILGSCTNVRLLPPLDYVGMQQALADAWILLTDSGGLQEEAPTFRVPVLVLRDETERPEAVDAGCARIVGAGRHAIVDAVIRLSGDNVAFTRMQRAGNPFGDGHASRRIVAALAAHFEVAHGTHGAMVARV